MISSRFLKDMEIESLVTLPGVDMEPKGDDIGVTEEDDRTSRSAAQRRMLGLK